MSFTKFFMIGVLLTAWCRMLPGAAAETKFSYRANERERLRQMQDAFTKIKRMVQISRSKPEIIDELNTFAESSIRKYGLNFSIEDIRLHGTLLKIMHGDRQAVAEARANKFVICGVKYGKRCWNCRGNGKECTYCQATGKCPSCEGAGRMNYASKGERCVHCEGSGRCSKCHGNPKSNPCNICAGVGVYCDPATLKGRQRRLFNRIMGERITDAFRYNYLGTLYKDGRDGFPTDEERSQLFFGMADRRGHLREELQRTKKLGDLPRAIAALKKLIGEHPDRANDPEVKKALTEHLHNLVVNEIKRAGRSSYGDAVGIMENLVKNYSDADNIADAQTALENYRRKFIAAEIERAGRKKSTSDAVNILEKAIRCCPEASNIAEAQKKLQFYKQVYAKEQQMLDQEVNKLIVKFYNSTSDSMYLSVRSLNFIGAFAAEAGALIDMHKSMNYNKKAVLEKIWIIHFSLKEADKWDGMSDISGFERDATRHLREVREDIENLHRNGYL